MGALDVSKGTVKSIYALGAKLGMVERGGGHADALHALVQGLTGKESITALTPAEAQAVLAELRRRSAPAAAPQKKRPGNAAAGSYGELVVKYHGLSANGTIPFRFRAGRFVVLWAAVFGMLLLKKDSKLHQISF